MYNFLASKNGNQDKHKSSVIEANLKYSPLKTMCEKGDRGSVVNECKARLFKNTQGRYLIYLPLSLAQDSMFPFKVSDFLYVRVGFKEGENALTISEWKENEDPPKTGKNPPLNATEI